MTYSKIHPLALAITLATLSGLATTGTSLMFFIFYTGKPFVAMLGSMYVSYNPTLMNCFFAGAMVFINTFVACYIVAWVYNFLLKYMPSLKVHKS
jgi:hypothetical protein